MITEEQYKQCATSLAVDVATIKAVAHVESGGEGFLPTGEPKILFEPHVFWKELKKRAYDPNKFARQKITVTINGKKVVMPCDNVNDPILYPIWVPGLYGPSSKQHKRLQRASEIDREAALSSASWGKFQILGNNWRLCDCATLQDFINAMYESEDKHLELFTDYIQNTYLDDELRAKDWAGFARGYNGPLYYKNSYDKKLKAAYQAFKTQTA